MRRRRRRRRNPNGNGNGHGLRKLQNELYDDAYELIFKRVVRYLKRHGMESRTQKSIVKKMLLKAVDDAFETILYHT